MSWNGLIAILLLFVPLAEMSDLRSAARKDIAMFVIVWSVAFAAIAAEWLGLSMPRPLDWIRLAAQPINRLLP